MKKDTIEYIHREPLPGEEILHEFQCRNCGKTIAVVDKRDKRSVFCCQHCEKQWWRDETRHADAVSKHNRDYRNIGMSGGMSLGSLIKRESRALKT